MKVTLINHNAGLGSWRYRRRTMFAVIVFCKLTIAYCLYKNLDTKVAESAVTMAFTTLFMVVGSYVFGAVWDDNNQIKALGKGDGEDK